jgi:ParB family chromosome partitioning protein
MSPRAVGMGRGLEALIPLIAEGETAVPQMVPVDQIRPADQQVRKTFDPESLRELADSIRAQGVLQPILVRRVPDGFELIAGERRWRAAQMVGLEMIPALVRRTTEEVERLVLGLIENLQRQNLDPMEEARGLQRLVTEFGLTHEQAAAHLGKHRVAVTQSLRLLNACPAVQSAASAGAISAGHARALVSLPTEEAQEQGLRVVLAKRFSVRQTEAWVQSYVARRPHSRPLKRASALTDLAEAVQGRLGVPVSITGGPQRGRVTIQYGSREELERIIQKLSR